MNNFQTLFFNFKSIEWRTRAFVWILGGSTLAAIILYWTLLVGFQSIAHKEIAEQPTGPNPFDSVEVEAKSAFVWDVESGQILFDKNADERLPLASLTKVMTAITAAQNARDRDKVTIRFEDLAPEGDSYLRVASSWNVRDLLDYVLLVSSNDGAHALAATIGATQNIEPEAARQQFIAQMNSLAHELGLASMVFMNEHGLDVDDSASGAYGSARDMAHLFEYALKNYPDLLEATRYPRLSLRDLNNDFYLANNTNEVISSIPSPIASKTGYTKLAGGNLVVAYDAGLGRPIIISVLGSSYDGRFSDMLKLVEASQAYLRQE